jgi:hypothetical protein
MESRFATYARTALVLVLVTALTGAPSALAQQSQPAASPNVAPTPVPQADQSSPQQPAQAPVPGNAQEEPSQGPLAPPPLPDSPSASQPPQEQEPAQQQPTTVQIAPPSNAPAVLSGHRPIDPQGAATAETAPTLGGAASKPAGAAIAPAKQRQMRSFLIKLGAIAGAGIALGTVYALTRGTSSTPPGAK